MEQDDDVTRLKRLRMECDELNNDAYKSACVLVETTKNKLTQLNKSIQELKHNIDARTKEEALNSWMVKNKLTEKNITVISIVSSGSAVMIRFSYPGRKKYSTLTFSLILTKDEVVLKQRHLSWLGQFEYEALDLEGQIQVIKKFVAKAHKEFDYLYETFKI